MLDDDSVKQTIAAGSMTPPQRQRYTVVTSPITPVTPPRDGDFFEGAPASSSQEGFIDYWLLVDSGRRGDRAPDVQAPSSDYARLFEPVEPSAGRDGKSCRTDPVCSARKLPVKRKLCLSSDETAERNGDSNKRSCKENMDPMSAVTVPVPILARNHNENKDVCAAQPLGVPVTQATAQSTTCSVSTGEVSKRSFQPYIPLSLHSAVQGQAGVSSHSKGEDQEKNISHNTGRVIPEMFNTNKTADDTRFYDYSTFYNGSFYPYQSGTWNPYSMYNSTMYSSGLTQGAQHTPMYPHLYNAPYQMTSSSGCTMPSQSYGTALYTQSSANNAALPELSQFKGSAPQSHSATQGYQHPYYHTYAGTGSNDMGKF